MAFLTRCLVLKEWLQPSMIAFPRVGLKIWGVSTGSTLGPLPTPCWACFRLITVFGKNEKDNLSAEEKQAIKAYVKGMLGE